MRKELAAELKSYFTNKLPTAKAFGGQYEKLTEKTALALQGDLERAEIPYENESGEVFDFHALRHTFITNLRNAPARVAQSLARHKSSQMTDRYTHIRLHDERAALDSLPDLSLPSKEKQAAVKTGTNDDFLSKSCFEDAQQRTPVDASGKKTAVTIQKPPSGANNEGPKQVVRLLLNPDSDPVKPDSDPQLVSSLFLESLNDPDLKLLIERWPKLSVETKRIIVRIIKTS